MVGKDGGQVERGDGINRKVDQIVRAQSVPRRWRRHVSLVGDPFAKGLTHRGLSPNQVTEFHWPPDYSNLFDEGQYSHRLLAPTG
jgi:hypothetical protein